MFGRTTLLAALALALALPASAPARRAASKAPTGLKAFLLRYDEPTSHTFSRTPSLGWKPISGAMSYDVQLSTSTNFRENSIIWSKDGLRTAYTAVPIVLPWITGHPYSLFARVRARMQKRTTPWGVDFGFNLRGTKPAQRAAPNGLLRWSTVEGATTYEVWEMDMTGDSAVASFSKSYTVGTNVTDMRDWFTFHQDLSWVGHARWRVRAVRELYGSATADGLPIVSYGPWSKAFTTAATPQTATRLSLGETVSDVSGTPGSPAAHALMPGFSWSGISAFSGERAELYRAYVYSDSDCVNPVMIGSVVGSPAWVPRFSGALPLPTSLDALITARGEVLLPDGTQGVTGSNSPGEITPNETGAATDTLDLWDRDWPSSVYWWTVVPVREYLTLDGSLSYKDAELPQDVCAAGRVARFGKVGKAVDTANKNAYVTGPGLALTVKSAAASGVPRVYGNTPLITWSPAPAADVYEVQWGHTRYPFSAIGNLGTQNTAAVLTLSPGVWYYRIRGIDTQIPGSQTTGWSSVRKLKIAKPTFRVSK